MEKKLPSRIRRKRNIKIKKSTVGIFVTIFAFVFSMFYVFAGENPKLVVTKIENANVGDTVVVRIDLQTNKEYTGIGFAVNYDPDKLELTKSSINPQWRELTAEENEQLEGLSMQEQNELIQEWGEAVSYGFTQKVTDTPGQVVFLSTFMQGGTANADNNIGKLTFKVKSGASGQVDITLDNIKMELINGDQSTELTVEKEDGYIKVNVPVDPESVRLNKESFEIQKGSTDTVSVLYEPENTTDSKEFTFTSSDDTIASVNSSGVITANQVGTATITVNAFGQTLSADVEVVAHITGITISGTKHELEKGEELQLSAAITPEDTGDDKTLTWESSNTAVAAVNSSGRVTAVAGGETVITATSWNNVVGTYNISVVVPMTDFTVDVENLSL